MIWKDAVVAYLRSYPGIYLEELRKITKKNPIVLTEVLTRHLPNMTEMLLPEATCSSEYGIYCYNLDGILWTGLLHVISVTNWLSYPHFQYAVVYIYSEFYA
jgi:hypothetical protein